MLTSFVDCIYDSLFWTSSSLNTDWQMRSNVYCMPSVNGYAIFIVYFIFYGNRLCWLGN